MSHTPLFSRLRQAVRLASLSNRTGIPAAETRELALSRRTFLQASAAGALLALGGCATSERSSDGAKCGDGGKKVDPKIQPIKTDARIAIIGGGVAGLNCAYMLKKAGVKATIYEASPRIGGRMFSRSDLLGGGLTTEVGGEFIDSGHSTILELINEFHLDMLDMTQDKGLQDCAYYFRDQHHTDVQVIEALKPYLERLEKDSAIAGELDDKLEPALAFDKLSITEYMDQLGMSDWLRDLIHVAFVTEFGLECQEQSALNLLTMIGLESKERFEPFGESDERYKVVGGNQRVCDELAKRLEGQIKTEHTLTAVAPKGSGYALTFLNGGTQEIDADVVVLTLPFTMLREVDLRVTLPADKKVAIAELGYGMNAKLMIGVNRRPWREAGFAGGIFTERAVQLAWDNARLQMPNSEKVAARPPRDAKDWPGGVTFYTGGNLSKSLQLGTPADQVKRLLPELDAAFMGTLPAYNEKLLRMHWPTHPFTKASYACYKPGQYATIRGHEFTPVGNLHFAGEHTSLDAQGYMEGGAESGARVAKDLMARLRK